MKTRPYKLAVLVNGSRKWFWEIRDEHGNPVMAGYDVGYSTEAECRNAAQGLLDKMATKGSLDCGSYQPE